MKICILGNVNLGYSWFYLTFKQGCQLLDHDVYEIDYRSNSIENIRKKLYSISPDVLFTHLTFHIIKPLDQILQVYRDVRKKCGTKVIHILADARHEPRYKGSIKGAIDFAFVSQTENLEKFKNYWDIPTFFCPYASMTQNELAPFNKSLAFNNPVFTGSPNSHPDRSEFIKKLQQLMPIHIFQTQSKQDLRHRTEELSISAKCILGLCTGYDISHYCEVRPFQYMGAGAFMITRKFKGMDDIIPDNLYIPFDSYSDNDARFVKEQFDYWKEKDTTLMRQEAFEFMQQFHSSMVRMENVLRVIEGKQDTTKSFIKEF